MTIDVIAKKISACAAGYGERIAAVYLFGSRNRGEAAPLSDLDLAVLFHPRERAHLLELRCALYADFSRALQTNDIDLTVLNTLDNMFLLDEIVREGTVLYDREPALRDDFELNALHRAIDFKQQRLQVMGV
jgi:uncharacterized protein